jgi:hypothetical protein
LWAAVTLSAHLSGHDDLLALVTGRPDPFRPAEAVPPDQTWINRWGALHALKPGFSLSDAPRLPDRLVGIAFVAGVVLLLRLAAPAVARRAGAQRLAVALALVHVGVWERCSRRRALEPRLERPVGRLPRRALDPERSYRFA